MLSVPPQRQLYPQRRLLECFCHRTKRRRGKGAKGGREQLQYVVIRSILRYLFDYVVSTGEDRGGNGDPKLLSGLQVDGELELRRLFRS